MKADKEKVKKLLATARGQINGIINMIDEDKYCIDISNQILASIGILKKANQEVLCAHLEHCVKNSIVEENDIDQKIKEINDTIKKLSN